MVRGFVSLTSSLAVHPSGRSTVPPAGAALIRAAVSHEVSAASAPSSRARPPGRRPTRPWTPPGSVADRLPRMPPGRSPRRAFSQSSLLEACSVRTFHPQPLPETRRGRGSFRLPGSSYPRSRAERIPRTAHTARPTAARNCPGGGFVRMWVGRGKKGPGRFLLRSPSLQRHGGYPAVTGLGPQSG